MPNALAEGFLGFIGGGPRRSGGSGSGGQSRDGDASRNGDGHPGGHGAPGPPEEIQRPPESRPGGDFPGDGPTGIPVRILFVCTGNTCRSPMAMSILRDMAARGLTPPLEVESAGTMAAPGVGMNEAARRVLARRGITETDSHASSPLDRWVPWADLILTMTRSHRDDVLAAYPGLEGKVYVLAQWALPAEWDHRKKHLASLWGETGPLEELRRAEGAVASLEVSDPFGGDDGHYEAAAGQLDFLLQQVAVRLHTEFPPTAAPPGPSA